MLSCALLGLTPVWPLEPALGDDVVGPRCLVVDFDLAGRTRWSTPDPGVAAAAELSRGRAEMGLLYGNLGARFALITVRARPDGGDLAGLGEPLLPQVQIAEARMAFPEVGLAVVGGLIDDPWVVSGNRSFGWRPLAKILTDDAGWFDRSDLGGMLVWTSPQRLVSARVTYLDGEGLSSRERNEGKNVTGMVSVRPLATAEGARGGLLEISMLARYGTRGEGGARDHRLAARVDGAVDGHVYGAEITHAMGVRGDADRTPTGLSAWGGVQPWGPLVGIGRVDLVREAPGDGGARATVLGAAGIRLRADGGPRGVHLVAGVERRQNGDAAAVIAGESRTTVFVQIGAVLRGTVDLTTREP